MVERELECFAFDAAQAVELMPECLNTSDKIINSLNNCDEGLRELLARVSVRMKGTSDELLEPSNITALEKCNRSIKTLLESRTYLNVLFEAFDDQEKKSKK